MAQKIKGIKIEIGGDTTNLGKALENVNSKTKSLQTELKGVNSLLKFDSTNVNLIKQKQDLLNQSITTTKEKLTTLKNAQIQVQAQFDKGEITTEQYRDFQREIISTENKLKSLKKEAKEFGNNMNSSLISASEQVQSFGNKVTSMGKKMLGTTTVITAGMVAGTTTAIKSMDEVDEGLDTVMKKTGATGESAKELQSIYEAVATKVPSAFGDIGAAVGEINTRLDFTGNQLENASVAFLKFAKVNDVDVNQAVQLVTRAMGDAGIESTEYQKLLDMITVAAQKSGVSIESLTTNLAKYGAPMRALGVDTKEAIAMFSAWEKAGVNTEIAFSGMKKAISNWGAAGKDSRVEFQRTLEEIKKCPDIASATTKAIEVFGAKAGPDLADAIQGGRFEFQTYVDALESSSGTIEDTYGMIVDEVDDAQLASQVFKLSLHSLGETITKTVGPIILSLANKFKNLMEKFNKMNPTVQKIILIVTALVAAIGPLLIMIGKIASGVSAMIKVFGTISKLVGIVKSAFVAFHTVLLANPIILIVSALAALVAGFILLWNKCEGFRLFWNNLWENVRSVCKSVIDSIINFFSGVIGFLNDNWQGLLLLIANPFIGAFKLLYDNCEEVKNFINTFLENIKQFFINAWDNIKLIFSAVPTFFFEIFSNAWTNVTSIFENIGNWFEKRMNIVKNVFKNAWNNITSIVRNSWNNILALFSNGGKIFNGMKEGIASIFKSIVDNLASGINKLIQKPFNSINSVLLRIKNLDIPVIGQPFKGIVNTIPIPQIPKFRTGATMIGDGQGIMAEAGSPEMITMLNGKAIIRPLTSTDRKQVLNTNNNSSSFNLKIDNFYNNRDQDVQALAEEFEYYRMKYSEAKGG